MRIKLATATAAVLALLVSGCSGADEPRSAKTPASSSAASPEHSGDSAPVDASVVRGRAEYDFPHTKSITAASRKAATVVVGEVVGWSDGRSMVESDGAGYEAISRTAVLTVKVKKAQGKSREGAGDLAYVEVPRGGEVLVDGQPPADTTPVLTTIEELTTAVPVGTRVILLANPARSADQLVADTPGLVVEGEGAGLPAGAQLLSPRIQGLLFRDETGAFASGLAEGEGDWGWLAPGTPRDREFASLVDELDRMG